MEETRGRGWTRLYRDNCVKRDLGKCCRAANECKRLEEVEAVGTGHHSGVVGTEYTETENRNLALAIFQTYRKRSGVQQISECTVSVKEGSLVEVMKMLLLIAIGGNIEMCVHNAYIVAIQP